MLNSDPHRTDSGHDRRDSTRPATPGRRVDVYLLCADDSLLLELGPLLGDRYRTRPIESIDALQDAGATAWMLVLDATARHDARAVVARIEQQHSLAPLIVICADGRAPDWAGTLSRGTVCAAVERRTLASGGLRDALAAAELRLGAAATQTTTNALNALRNERGGTGKRPAWLLPLVGIVALAVAGAWWAFHSQVPTAVDSAAHGPPTLALAGSAGSSPPATQPPLSAPPASPARSTLELLSDARIAFRDEKLLLPHIDTAPNGTSALELYAQVLNQEPQNDEARDGMRRLFSVARARMQADLNAGKLDEASRLLGFFRNVGLDGAAVNKVEADIAAARPRWLVAQARTALASGELDTARQLIAQIGAGGADRAVLNELHRTLDARASDAQLGELATRARAAISSGALLEPAADNARTRLQAMLQINRGHALTQAVQRELQGALLARAQGALRAQSLDSAQQNLNAAADLGNSAEVGALRKQLQAELEARTARAAPPALAAPNASAPSAALASTPALPEFLSARPVGRFVAEFPESAQRRGVTGHVIVEFTLDTHGRAQNPRIVESVPAGTFDAAAVTAVRSGRFDTSALGSPPQPHRARLLVTFK